MPSAGPIRRLIDTLAAILDEAIEDMHITINPARSKRMRIQTRPRRSTSGAATSAGARSARSSAAAARASASCATCGSATCACTTPPAHFNIPDSKTETGIREIQMSPDLVEVVIDHIDRMRR